jgi:hypothetical protein
VSLDRAARNRYRPAPVGTIFMQPVRIVLVAAAALALSACFVTREPLITQANAVWPFAHGTAFTAYSWKDETKTWEASGSGSVLRLGDRYRLHPNPDPDSGEAPDPDDDTDFLLADMGDGYYMAEARTKESAILVDVIKVEGATVLQYVLMCEPEDKKLADERIIDGFEAGEFTNSCRVSSIDQVRRAFRAKLAAGMVPQARYVKTP